MKRSAVPRRAALGTLLLGATAPLFGCASGGDTRRTDVYLVQDGPLTSNDLANAPVAGDTAIQYQDGVKMWWSNIRSIRLSSTAAAQTSNWTIAWGADLSVYNGSSKPIDLGPLQVRCRYGGGGFIAARIFDAANGIHNGVYGELLPGHTITGLYGFGFMAGVAAAPAYLDVMPGDAHPPQFFRFEW